MTNLAYERLHENLIKLKLNTVGTILDNYLEIAAKEGKTTLEVLDYLVDQEKHARNALSQETKMKREGFPVNKRLEDLTFDSEGAHCFFQLVSKRYEKTSIIFTSNKSYGD